MCWALFVVEGRMPLDALLAANPNVLLMIIVLVEVIIVGAVAREYQKQLPERIRALNANTEAFTLLRIAIESQKAATLAQTAEIADLRNMIQELGRKIDAQPAQVRVVIVDELIKHLRNKSVT
jgi:Asp-tRNA(Asn)/Glu-tRNA(Gln) amidotransferase B subunit